MNKFVCPEHVNPAEFFADLISIDYSSSKSENLSQKRIDYMIEAFANKFSMISDRKGWQRFQVKIKELFYRYRRVRLIGGCGEIQSLKVFKSLKTAFEGKRLHHNFC